MMPLGQIATISLAQGASTIRTENAQLVSYIYVDTRDSDIGGFVARAQRAVTQDVKFPPGYRAVWSGQFEYLERAKARLMLVIPLTIAIIFVLLYLNFGRMAETLIVMLSVPFSLIGGMVSSTILTLIVILAIYAALKARVVDQWRSAP